MRRAKWIAKTVCPVPGSLGKVIRVMYPGPREPYTSPYGRAFVPDQDPASLPGEPSGAYVCSEDDYEEV